MLVGPTGFGKTFMAECLARSWGGPQGSPLCKLRMNEYNKGYDISRLVGAAPGLIGHERQRILFRFAEENPRGVILLDEIEKAHPEVQDCFLEIFDQREPTLAAGGHTFVHISSFSQPISRKTARKHEWGLCLGRGNQVSKPSRQSARCPPPCGQNSWPASTVSSS